MEKRREVKTRQTLLFTGYALAGICLVLEMIVPFVEFGNIWYIDNINWILRWIVLSNVLNGIILAVETILMKKFRNKKRKQFYVASFSLVAICTVIACQHYYFTHTQLIFVIPILLSVPIMIEKLNILVSCTSFAGILLSFLVRYGDGEAAHNFWADLIICITYALLIGKISHHLVVYLIKQNEKLVASKNEAEKANRAKSDFLSNMSHEIRTPINSIIGMNEMIKREAKEENILGYSSNIERSGEALLSLINDILDLSKIESGKIEIIENEYSLETLIRETVTMVQSRIEKKGLEFEIVFDEKLPVTLMGDSARIREILLNFLTNAAKYTREGKVTYSISGIRKVDSINMVFSVKDTGNGIREEDLRKMYGRFERFDLEKNRNIEGTGLGLRISKQLAKLMGGDINAESEYGKGSVFSLYLNQKIVNYDSVGKVDFKKSGNIDGKKYSVLFTAPDAKILVVDDIDMNLFVIENLLKKTEMQIDIAQSGEDCLKLSSNQKYDLILIDHMMPGMNGIDTFRELKGDSENPNLETPCIMLTANAYSGAKEMYEQEGFAGYITKPIDCNQLEEKIIEHLPKEKVRLEKAD